MHGLGKKSTIYFVNYILFPWRRKCTGELREKSTILWMIFSFHGEINGRFRGEIYYFVNDVYFSWRNKRTGKWRLLRCERREKKIPWKVASAEGKKIPREKKVGTGWRVGGNGCRRRFTVRSSDPNSPHLPCVLSPVQLLETFPGAGAHLCPPIHFEFELAQYSPILSNVLTWP